MPLENPNPGPQRQGTLAVFRTLDTEGVTEQRQYVSRKGAGIGRIAGFLEPCPSGFGWDSGRIQQDSMGFQGGEHGFRGIPWCKK